MALYFYYICWIGNWLNCAKLFTSSVDYWILFGTIIYKKRKLVYIFICHAHSVHHVLYICIKLTATLDFAVHLYKSLILFSPLNFNRCCNSAFCVILLTFDFIFISIVYISFIDLKIYFVQKKHLYFFYLIA